MFYSVSTSFQVIRSVQEGKYRLIIQKRLIDPLSLNFGALWKATVECKMEACREKKSKKILTPKDFIGLGPYYIGMQPEGDFTGF